MIKDFSIPDLQGLCSIQNTGTKGDPTTPSITSVPSIINNKLTGKVSSPGFQKSKRLGCGSVVKGVTNQDGCMI